MEHRQRLQPPLLTIRMLTDAQLDEIHRASLSILAKTGVRVQNSEAVELLESAGSSIHAGDLVRIPESVIEAALEAAPAQVDLYSRTGELRLELTEFNTYFGTGSDLPNTIDLVSSERRPSVLADVKAYARLCDCLENLDFVMSMAQASDVPVRTSDRRSFLAMMENTVKPIVYTVWDTAGLTDIIQMAEMVAGGERRLAEKPFMLGYLEPTSPLVHSDEVLDKMLQLADKGLPFVYAPGPIEGASAPVTSGGSLAMANAECLSGLAIAQLRNPGTPVVFGSGSGPLDMKTTVSTYSSPEFMHHCLGMAELAHHRYHLPAWGFSGCSDSKLPDIQAGAESALWILWTALSGANLVHDLGYIESGLTGSFEMVVVAEEIISFVRRLMGGIETSSSALALDVIDAVGPGGDFLSTAHTLENFRSIWQPSLLDRNNYQGWVAAGRPNMIRTAREVAIEAIGSHVPLAISDSLKSDLEEVVRAADQHFGVEL
jgi:trimethylamine--corrinoid protein Co-methyltransferase